MVENKSLREEQDWGGSNPDEVFDFNYFRTKFNMTKDELIDAIKEAKTNNPIQLEEYIAGKYNLSKDKPDQGST